MARKILVVEDSPTQAERVRLLLEEAGYRVDIAGNGREGLERVQSAAPDLIISDIVMPEMDGYAFCQAVKSAEPTKRIPFVLLTSQNAPEDIIKGLERGADNFITKPFEEDYLLERVQRIFEHLELRKQGPLSTEVTLSVAGRQLTVNADKQQIFELLFSTFDELGRANAALREHERELEAANQGLEREITERKRMEETIRGLYRASLQVQERLELKERLAHLIQAAREVLHLDRLNILLAAAEGGWLQAVASTETQESLEAIRVPIGPEGGAVARAYLTMQPIVWEGKGPVPEELRLKPPYDRIEAFRSRVFANVPLVVYGRAVGVLGADQKHSRRPFEPTTLEGLRLFANLAALAIENARIYMDLEAANQQLQEASRHKSEFLANMSHELRTPLNSVIGFSDLLLERTTGPLNEKQARFLTNIHNSGRHLLQLISDILDLSKVEAGKVVLQPEALPVAGTLEDILVIARGIAHKKAQTVEAQIDPELPPLRADPVRFKQILFNLLSNAIKFTPDRGRVTVTARRVPGSTFHVPSSGTATEVAQPGTWDPAPGTPQSLDVIEIAVADTGIGIKAEDLPRLFQEFVQLEAAATKRYEGTGLGLALTRRLVELHGGRIWAESAGEGRGTTVTVVLPFEGPGEAPES